MDFNLNEEQTMLVNTIRKMGERENFRELAKNIDATGEFPHYLWEKYAEVGLLGMTINPEWGGGGQPAINAILVVEELAKFSPAIAAPVFESNIGPVRILEQWGTEEQKRRIIPGVCTGVFSVSAGMTEASAGSDLSSLKTKAEDKGDHYVLNGSKMFISGGGEASHYLVWSRFGDVPGSKGIGALLVEKGTLGFSFGKQEDFLGLRGMASCELIFEDVVVPKENLVVGAGNFNKLMTGFDLERCGNATMCLGVARGALEEVIKYTSEREAFGRPICEFQGVQFPVVDIAMQLDAARLLVYRAVSNAGTGLPSMFQAGMAKCFANEMVVEVTNKALQLFGGYGYSKEYPIERMLRDGRAWGIAGGTTQMLRVGIASALYGRRFNQRK